MIRFPALLRGLPYTRLLPRGSWPKGFVIAVGILLLTAALAVFLLSMGANLLRGELQSRASAFFRRPVMLDGPIGLKPSLSPTLVLESVRMANPPSASRSDRVFAARLELRVSVASALQGKFEVAHGFVEGADIQFETNHDSIGPIAGLANSHGEMPIIHSLTVRQSKVSIRDRGTGTLVQALISQADFTASEGQPTDFSIKGICCYSPTSAPFELAGRLNRPARGQSDMDFTGSIGPLGFKGKVAWVVDPALRPVAPSQSKTAQASSKTPEATRTDRLGADNLSPLLDQPLPAKLLRAVTGDLRIDFSPRKARPEKGQQGALSGALRGGLLKLSLRLLKLDGSTVAGRFELDAGGAIPRVRLSVSLDKVDVRRLLRLPPSEDGIDAVVDRMNLAIASRGRTVRSLLHKAALEITTRSASLSLPDSAVHDVQQITIVRGDITAEEGRPMGLSLFGWIHDLPFTLAMRGGTLAQLGTCCEPWPINLSGRVGTTNLSAVGTIAQPFQGQGLEVDFSVKGGRTRMFGPLFGVSLPPLGPYELTGRVARDGCQGNAARNRL